MPGLMRCQRSVGTYPKARVAFSGFGASALNRFARLGGDPARVFVESRPRTTSEDALYSTALLKPKPGEKWLLVTLAWHMPRAVGCFRVAGFEVEPYPLGVRTGGPSHLFTWKVLAPQLFSSSTWPRRSGSASSPTG
jgi:uncharacterized SAM-binding protein YcdF (DUF218 family)